MNIAADADPAVVSNNLFSGGGTITNQASAVLRSNYDGDVPCLVDAAAYDYQLLAGSPCVNGGVAAGDDDGFALAPDAHYVHPRQGSGRASVDVIDIGAYELGGDVTAEGGAGSGEGGMDAGGAAGAAAGKLNTAGSSGASGAGGPSGHGGSTTTGGGSNAPAAPPESDSGCGCRSAGPAGGAPLALLGLLLLLGARRRGYWQ